MNLSLEQHPRVRQAICVVLFILWSVTFVGVHWAAACLVLIPLLALATFALLSPFPIAVGALFLSAYLSTSDQMSATVHLLLIGIVWLAAFITLFAKVVVRRPRVTPSQPQPENLESTAETRSQSTLSTPEPMKSVSSEVMLTPNLRHDLKTPLNLILGFCEALLNPASADRQPLPAPFREDVEAIYRNGQQLKPLIEKLFERPTLPQANSENPTELATARPRKSVILFDEGEAALELFSLYLHQYEVIRVSSVEAIGRLHLDSDVLAVAINSDDSTLIPVIAQLMGNSIPIVTFNLTNAQSQTQFHGASDYLMKPVEFEALMAALERTGASLHTILIVDDNRDNIQMLSRMLNSVAEPPHLLKAYTGREALALLHEEIPDVILLDFVLPDMDGIALLNYLHADSRLARIPVILVSAHRPPDILPIAGTTKLTLFRLASLSPLQLARHIEALFTTFGSQP